MAWEKSLTEEEIRGKRAAVIEALRHADAEMDTSGLKAAWLSGVDKDTKRIVEEVNGELFSQLLEITKHKHLRAAEVLREGVFFICVQCSAAVCCLSLLY